MSTILRKKLSFTTTPRSFFPIYSWVEYLSKIIIINQAFYFVDMSFLRYLQNVWHKKSSQYVAAVIIKLPITYAALGWIIISVLKIGYVWPERGPHSFGSIWGHHHTHGSLVSSGLGREMLQRESREGKSLPIPSTPSASWPTWCCPVGPWVVWCAPSLGNL